MGLLANRGGWSEHPFILTGRTCARGPPAAQPKGWSQHSGRERDKQDITLAAVLQILWETSVPSLSCPGVQPGLRMNFVLEKDGVKASDYVPGCCSERKERHNSPVTVMFETSWNKIRFPVEGKRNTSLCPPSQQLCRADPLPSQFGVGG